MSTQAPRVHVVAAAVGRRAGTVLLVPGPAGWALPGGTVAASEDATHALAGAVAAGTGLRVVAHRGLAYAIEYVRPAEVTLTFVFDLAADGEPVGPAAFVPVADAIDRLGPTPLSEPAAAYLSGAEHPGAYWTYGDVAGVAEVTARIPGRAMR